MQPSLLAMYVEAVVAGPLFLNSALTQRLAVAAAAPQLQEAAINHFLAAEHFVQAHKAVTDDGAADSDTARALALLADDAHGRGRCLQLEGRLLAAAAAPHAHAARFGQAPVSASAGAEVHSSAAILPEYFNPAAVPEVQAGAQTLDAAHRDVAALRSALPAMQTGPALAGSAAPSLPTAPKAPAAPVLPATRGAAAAAAVPSSTAPMSSEVSRLLVALQTLGDENAALLQERISAAELKQQLKQREAALAQRLAEFHKAFRALGCAAALPCCRCWG